MRPLIKKKHILIALPVLLLLCLGAYYLFRPPSSDDIAFMTVRALEKGDVDSLLNLTLPQERDRLKLTHDSVYGFLHQTLWSNGLPADLTLEKRSQRPVDEVLYAAQPKPGNEKGMNYPLYILVEDSPDQGWHLALSFTLFESVAVKYKPEGREDVREGFNTLASRYGILGYRRNVSGYLYIASTLASDKSLNK